MKFSHLPKRTLDTMCIAWLTHSPRTIFYVGYDKLNGRRLMMLHRQHFAAGGLEFFSGSLWTCFDVAADERFGAAGAEGGPTRCLAGEI